MLQEENPDFALELFHNLPLPIIDKNTFVRKVTEKNVMAPWCDQELKEFMVQRDKSKAEAMKLDR